MRAVSQPETDFSRPEAPQARQLLSIVVLASQRVTSLTKLYHDCCAHLGDDVPYEFIVVADPWASARVQEFDALIAEGHPIVPLLVGQPQGETGLLRIGLQHARGQVLLVLPGYPRVEAGGYRRLLRAVSNGADLAVARRWPRSDAAVNRLQNRAFHALVHLSIGGSLHDIACGVFAARKGMLESIPIYGDRLRFLPILAERDGFEVTEVDIPQHQGDKGSRVYGPGVYFRRLLDVLGLFFVLRFTEKPLRFFGLVGGALAAVGSTLLLILFVQRLGGQGIADRPLLILGNLVLVLGVQAIALGLIGEVIVNLHASSRRSYRLRSNESDERDESGEQTRKQGVRQEHLT